jgi:hypothetical protein
VTLPSRAVASTARALDARMAGLVLSVVAGTLSRLLRSRGERTKGMRPAHGGAAGGAERVGPPAG